MFFPPGTPADRATIIRQAFQKVLADESVIAEAKKRRLEFDPTAGHDLEKLAKEVMIQPPEIVAKMRQLLGK